jgi:Family of unknown function (DUF5990)
MNVRVRVIGRDLPGIRFCDRDGSVREPVYLGIQRGREVIEAVPADVKQAEFLPEFRVERGIGGAPNFLGPFAQGTAADRFFYLSWGVKRPSGSFEMFRRLKIRLGHLTWREIEAASRSGAPIDVELSLTDPRGAPMCATPRPESITWRSSGSKAASRGRI